MLLLLSLFLSLSPKWQLQCVKAEDGDRRKAQHNTYSASARSLNWWHLFGCCLRFAVPSLFFFFSFFSTKGFLCAFLFLLWIWFIASESEGRRITEGNGMEGKGEKEKEKRKRLPACWQNALCWGIAIATAADWSHAFDFSLKALGLLFFPLAGS